MSGERLETQVSQLLDKLLTPSQRSEVTMADRMLGAPLTIPAPRSVREQTLMADLAAERVGREAAEQRADELARTVARLSSELRTLKGDDALPQRGCRLVTVPFLMGSLLCEVEGTDKDDSAVVCNVFINGRWLDPQDVASDMSIDHLMELVIDAEAE